MPLPQHFDSNSQAANNNISLLTVNHVSEICLQNHNIWQKSENLERYLNIFVPKMSEICLQNHNFWPKSDHLERYLKKNTQKCQNLFTKSQFLIEIWA